MLPSHAAVTKSAWLAGAGVVATVIGFAKTIAPLIELGVALVVIAMISAPRSKS